jgi:hypothetical protein
MWIRLYNRFRDYWQARPVETCNAWSLKMNILERERARDNLEFGLLFIYAKQHESEIDLKQIYLSGRTW